MTYLVIKMISYGRECFVETSGYLIVIDVKKLISVNDFYPSESITKTIVKQNVFSEVSFSI